MGVFVSFFVGSLPFVDYFPLRGFCVCLSFRRSFQVHIVSRAPFLGAMVCLKFVYISYNLHRTLIEVTLLFLTQSFHSQVQNAGNGAWTM
jgi:hypothetical protein